MITDDVSRQIIEELERLDSTAEFIGRRSITSGSSWHVYKLNERYYAAMLTGVGFIDVFEIDEHQIKDFIE